MTERRPTNSELHLQQLEEQEQLEQQELEQDGERGILELFGDAADEPLERDEDR